MDENFLKNLENINKKLDDLSFDFKEDKEKNKIIDRLHSEVMEFRNDLLSKQADNIFLEIIHLIDANRKLKNDIMESDIENKNIIANYIDSLDFDLTDILYRNNVEEYISDNEELDFKLQTIVSSIDSDDPNKIGKRSRTISAGYHRDGTVLRKERIEVYRERKGD